MELIEQWREFNVAMVGATAALAGLAIVAASVNISEIVKAVSLTARLATGISGLVLAIFGSAIGLIPDLPLSAYGWTMLILSLIASAFPIDAARRIYQNAAPENRLRPVKSLVGFAPSIAYLVGAVLLVSGASAAGLVGFAIGSMAAIAAAIVISWIVLVEVLR